MAKELEKITVYNYGSPSLDLKPIKMEVEAWCAAGKEGIIAYFIHDGLLHEAHGDDGHWKLVNRFDLFWIEELKLTINSIVVSKKDIRQNKERTKK